MGASRARFAALLGDVTDDCAALESDLVPVDRILQRWSVSVGLGLPTEAWDDRRVSRPTPLDDVTAIVVDQAILKAPPRTQRLIRKWYRQVNAPMRVLCEEMGMSRRALIKSWRITLNFMRLKFEMTGHKSLLRLLNGDASIRGKIDE